jgi:hypothetical protein
MPSVVVAGEEMTTAQVEHFHRERAQIEARFKDSNLGQALRHLPSGKLAANRLWLCCALMASNVCAWVCDISPPRPPLGKPPTTTPHSDGTPRHSGDCCTACRDESCAPPAG